MKAKLYGDWWGLDEPDPVPGAGTEKSWESWAAAAIVGLTVLALVLLIAGR